MQESKSLHCSWFLSSALYILHQQIVAVLWSVLSHVPADHIVWNLQNSPYLLPWDYGDGFIKLKAWENAP